MRICMISPQFYPIVGGTEKQAAALAFILQEQGHTVFLLTQAIPGVPRGEASVQGLKVYRDITGTGLKYILTTFSFLWKKKKEYDLIHCHLLYLQVVAAVIAGKLLKKPVLVKVACSGEWGDVARMKKMFGSGLLLGICRRAAGFISLSQEIKSELTGSGVSPAKIIDYHNFVDTAKFIAVGKQDKLACRKKLSLPLEGKLVVFAGRLEKQKGVLDLAAAWKEVSREYNQASLAIVGKGLLFNEMVSILAPAPQNWRVIFVPETEAVYQYLQAADIFVLPSVSEGMSNSLLEAMSCGLACVVSDIGGNRELVEGGSGGILVTPHNPQSLAKGILNLLTDETAAARLSSYGSRKVRQEYDTISAAKKYLELYKGLSI